jgi:DHA3 family multidrug efflux protein-like MFS transporter
MKSFYKLLGIALVVATTNNFVWFALTFWAYLTTKSVISTSIVAGSWIVTSILTGIWFGSIVDHHKKKGAMAGSSIATLVLFSLGLVIYTLSPQSAFVSVASPAFWLFALTLLGGVIAGGIYNIALPTLIGVMVEEDKRDKANGMFGTVMGISFAITSVASGLVLAYGGMSWVLTLAILFTVLSLVILSFIHIPEKKIIHTEHTESGFVTNKKVDIKGTIKAVAAVPGLFALIFFTTFNNFLGGVFMSLMDAYGLTLVNVQTWGMLWGILSFSFITGGLYVAKKGLGKTPLRNLFRINIIMWTVCIFFTIQPSIILMAVGIFIYMFFIPFVEATEQTIFQKVVPPDRLGRVFGFAHALEQSASPLTAFFIGPIAQIVFIPFMTTGRGVELIGNWFGTGPGRGMALVFIIAGILGLIVTLIAMRSRQYKLLADHYSMPKTKNKK